MEVTNTLTYYDAETINDKKVYRITAFKKWSNSGTNEAF
jgi:hypothetical protein